VVVLCSLSGGLPSSSEGCRQNPSRLSLNTLTIAPAPFWVQGLAPMKGYIMLSLHFMGDDAYQTKETKMGKLTLALAATKELRKQFAKPKKVKALTGKNKKIQDAIYDSDFGCKKENVAKLIGAVIGVNLVKLNADKGKYFQPTRGAIMVFIREGSKNFGVVACEDGRGTELQWLDENRKSHSAYRRWEYWKPATDKQIKEYYS